MTKEQDSEIPGEILISDIIKSRTPEELEKEGKKFLKDNEKLAGELKKHGKDAVAVVTSRGPVLYVGIGVLLLAGIIGAKVIYDHRKEQVKNPRLDIRKK